QLGRQPEVAAALVAAHQAGIGQAGKAAAERSQRRVMLGMAIDWNAKLSKLGQGAVFPVVAVRMREKDGADLAPGSADGREAGGELPRAKSRVDEQAEAIELDQAGVAGTAAGQHGKAHHRGQSTSWDGGTSCSEYTTIYNRLHTGKPN